MALNLQTKHQMYSEQSLTQSLTNIIPTVRLLPALDKLKLIQILAEDIERDRTFFPFEDGKTYPLPTPYDSYDAATMLAEAMASYGDEDVKE